MYIRENEFESYDVYDEKNYFVSNFETESEAYAFIIMKEREKRNEI